MVGAAARPLWVALAATCLFGCAEPAWIAKVGRVLTENHDPDATPATTVAAGKADVSSVEMPLEDELWCLEASTIRHEEFVKAFVPSLEAHPMLEHIAEGAKVVSYVKNSRGSYLSIRAVGQAPASEIVVPVPLSEPYRGELGLKVDHPASPWCFAVGLPNPNAIFITTTPVAVRVSIFRSGTALVQRELVARELQFWQVRTAERSAKIMGAFRSNGTGSSESSLLVVTEPAAMDLTNTCNSLVLLRVDAALTPECLTASR